MCNNTIRSEFHIKIVTEKCIIFFISVSCLLSHKESYCLVRWLSITNMMAIQTQKRVVVCTLTLFLAIYHSLLGKAVNNFLTHYSNNDLSKDNCCLLNCCLLR